MIARSAVGLFLAAALLAAAPARAQVALAIDDGLVTLTADNATLREIMAEWERVGDTTIFNLDRLGGPPLTLRLERVREERALEILLRDLSGYLAAPRAEAVDGRSRFDRIMVMPGRVPPRTATFAAQPAPDSSDDLLIQQPVIPEAEDAAPERPIRIVPPPAQRGGFRAFPSEEPPPQESAEPPPPVYGPRPVAPPGVPVPGMIVPAPEREQESGDPQPTSGS